MGLEKVIGNLENGEQRSLKMPSGCSQSICRIIEKENKLCPNGHDFGEWHIRRWRKSRKLYQIRFRVCKRCKKREMQTDETMKK